jgi:microcompartment protein CcmL/EutN
LSEPRDPAIALLEFESISAGIVAGDAMVKAAPIGTVYAGTVHPGKYLVLVSGDTASVEEAMAAGVEASAPALTDRVFLPDIHPDVTSAVVGNAPRAPVGDEALGIVESTSVASVLDGADAGVKAAQVELAGIRLADGLGGKAYLLFSGVVAEVEVAVQAAEDRLDPHGTLVRADVIAQLHGEMADNLRRDLTFLARVSIHRGDD